MWCLSLSRVAFFALLLSSVLALQLPDMFPRQAPGSPNSACHEDCGLVTQYWHKGGDYCDTADFKSHLSNCLECALTQDIWQWYGEDVKNAAKKCHVDATPSPSSANGPSPATTSVTDSGESSSSHTTTGEAPTSKTDTSATTTSATGQSTSSASAFTSKTSESETGKPNTTTATADESSSSPKTTAEHTSTIAIASGTPHVSTSAGASGTAHNSTSAKGSSPTTSSASPVFNAASPIEKNAVLAALMGVLAWAFAA